MLIHIVSEGETISSVARRYGVSAEILAFNNDISEGVRLPIGQPLIIVIPTLTHTVSEGESLEDIARLYGVSIYELWQRNLILNGRSDIYPSQVLTIRTERSPIGQFMTGGYAYPFIEPSLLTRSLSLMGSVMPFTYGFRTDGTLIPLNDDVLLRSAAFYGTFPVMHLSTLTEGNNFSTELAVALFASETMQQSLISNILANMQEKGYRALDIDFEFLGAENAAAYADFVLRCREVLNREGYGVMTALAPKTRADQPGLLYAGHDYRALGQAANALLLMTYEWGYTFGPPLAVSPLPQVEEVIRYALTEIESQKLFLGISNYGYDFVLPYVRGQSRAQSLSTAQAFSIASQTGAEIQYDEVAQAPFFQYTASDGTVHEVWFEDARSISARLELIPKYSLRGALYWNLDRRNTQNLALIEQIVNLKEFSIL